MHITDPKLLLILFSTSMIALLILPNLFWQGLAKFRAWRNADVNWQLMQYRKQQKMKAKAEGKEDQDS